MADIIGGKLGSDLFVEERVLTAGEVAAKELVLLYTPAPDTLVINIPHGTVQKSFFDYELTGNTVNWNGKGLETIIEAGDTLTITYAKT